MGFSCPMVSMPPALFAIFLAILWLFTYCDETKSRKIHLRQSGSKRIANKRWKVARQVGLRKCVPTLREVTSTHFACYSAKVPIDYTKARDARYYSIVFSTELIGMWKINRCFLRRLFYLSTLPIQPVQCYLPFIWLVSYVLLLGII